MSDGNIFLLVSSEEKVSIECLKFGPMKGRNKSLGKWMREVTKCGGPFYSRWWCAVAWSSLQHPCLWWYGCGEMLCLLMVCYKGRVIPMILGTMMETAVGGKANSLNGTSSNYSLQEKEGGKNYFRSNWLEYCFNLVIWLFTLELNCSHEGYFEGAKFVVFGDIFVLLRRFALVTGITLYHSWSSVDPLALKLRALCRPGEVRGFSDVAVSGRLGRQFHRKPPSRVWVVNVLFLLGTGLWSEGEKPIW